MYYKLIERQQDCPWGEIIPYSESMNYINRELKVTLQFLLNGIYFHTGMLRAPIRH